MELLLLLGRILFVTFFVIGGLGHFIRRPMLVGYARSLGVPAADVLVPFGGLLILAGSISIALGLWPDLGAILLIAFLVPVTLWGQPFWKMTGEQRQMPGLNFWRHVSLAGGAVVNPLFIVRGIAPWSLIGPLLAM